MSTCWTLVVLLLCARTVDLRHRGPSEVHPGQGTLNPWRDVLDLGSSRAHREAGESVSRGAEEGAPSAGFRLETARSAPEGLENPAQGAQDPGKDGPNPGGRGRVSRGTRVGAWRRKHPGTSVPDQFFTTTRPVPPPVNVSHGDAQLPLSGSALWPYAVLLLALVLFSAGLVGNLALMCLVWHSFQLKSAWNCVLAGLALWDFLVLFFCLPVVLVHQLTGTRLMGSLSCSFVPFLEVSSMGVATFSLCALSIDRFHGATNPALVSAHVEPCTSILSKLSVVWVGSLLLSSPELLLYRCSQLPLQAIEGYHNPQVDVCLSEPSPQLPLAVLSLVLTYQEARSWWLFGCYLCLPLLFVLSCDLVTRRVMSQRAPQMTGRQDGGGGSRGSSPSAMMKDAPTNRSPSPSVSKQEVSSRTSSLNRKLQEREAGLRSVVMALVGLYTACTLPETLCTIAVSYVSSLPVGVMPALRLIGQFLLFIRSSATPLLVLYFSKALGRAFLHCCCCCCDECGAGPASSAADTPTMSLTTPSTLLATPLVLLTTPIKETLPEEQHLALGTPC